MVSNQHDLTTIVTKGNLCLWHMLIVITQTQKSKAMDSHIQPMLNAAKSLAASLSDDCPVEFVYGYNKNDNVLGAFAQHQHIIDAWVNYCDAIAMTLKKPLETGKNESVKQQKLSLQHYIAVGFDNRLISCQKTAVGGQQLVIGECPSQHECIACTHNTDILYRPL